MFLNSEITCDIQSTHSMQNKTNLNKTNYQEVFVSTLSEFLKLEENQAIVLDRIVEILRTSGSWGKRGLFVKVANDTGFSAAYVGQVLTGKKPLTDEFVGKIADYLKVSVKYLRGEEITSQAAQELSKILTDYAVNGIETPEQELINKISAAYKEQNPLASDAEVRVNVKNFINNFMQTLVDSLQVLGCDEIVEVKFLNEADSSKSLQKPS